MAFTSLKRKIVLYFSGLAACLMVLGATLWRISDTRQHLIAASDHRNTLLQLAHELRRNADELTHMARTYVVTGDPMFKQYHRDILSIRHGSKPRPKNYNYQYWDMVVANKQRPDSDGEYVPLSKLIRQHELTKEELAVLAEAESRAKIMNSIEHRAMTLSDAPNGRSLVDRETRSDSAYILLYGQPYYEAKTALLASVDRFITGVDDRTKVYSLAGRERVQRLTNFISIMAIITLVYAVVGWWLFSRLIANPLTTLLSTIGQTVPIESAEQGRGYKGEIDALANVYEDLLHKLAMGMQDLKRANEQLSGHSDELSLKNQELAGHTSLLDATLSNISQGVSVFDSEARLLTWNDRYIELYGLNPEQVYAGMSLDALMDLAIFHDEPHASELRKEWDVRIRSMQQFLIEEVLPDGRVFEIQSVVTPGRLLVVTQTDITERKAIEQVKNEFVSTVSHELRTPLTSIAGSLGLLAGGGAGELPDRAKKLITIAYNNSQRLVRLVNDILDLEKIDAGKMVFKIMPTSIKQVMEQSIEASRGYADSFSVRLRLADDAEDGIVSGDPDRLAQVFINLLSNATKFSPHGAFVDVAITRMGEMIRITVQDYGRGIPLEFRSAVFSKFAQADASDRRQQGGTGLGLNISRNIVEQHDGRISFDSEVGKGTQFFVDLPVWPLSENDRGSDRAGATDTTPFSSGEAEQDTQSYVTASASVGMAATESANVHVTNNVDPAKAPEIPRILHVEDDADIQAVVKASLEGTAEVVAAGSLATARASLYLHTFDLVILDLNLPDGSGLELIPLRRNQNGKLTPIIIFSVEETDPPAVLQVVTSLTKSRVSIDELVDRVKGVLTHQQLGVTRKSISRNTAGSSAGPRD